MTSKIVLENERMQSKLRKREKEAIDLKNKIEDRITFKVKSGYIWLSLAAETIKLHGSKKNITRDKKV